MRIRLVVRFDDDAAVWQREVDRPYPGVPRPQDWVYLGETDDGEGLFSTPVAVVTWQNDGTVVLRFDVGAGGSGAASSLEMLGFTKTERRS
jgi:hypothetical protein